jgi:transcriptional regulator with XRE-family HTH domain
MVHSVGERLKLQRIQRGHTQKSLGDVLGIPQQQIHRWEQGGVQPSADQLVRLATALACTTDWLLGLVEGETDLVQMPDLSPDEWQLLTLYRRGDLPTLIQQLVLELAGKNVKPERSHEPKVAEVEVTPDR